MSKKAILWNPEDRRIDNQKIVLAENVAYGFRPEEIRKFQFKCCGQIKGERCLADLELVCLDSDNIEPYFRQKKGTGVKTHKKGCPFDETADSRIITAVSRNLSGTDLEAICKGLERGKAVRNSTSDEDSTGGEKSSDPSEEAERDDVGIPEKRYNPAKKLHEVFLLSLTHLENEMFKNKQMVGDHVLNSFTYESFRSGERKLDGYSLVPAERFMDRDIMVRSSKQTELLVPVFVQQERKDYLNSDYDNYFEDE